MKVLLGLSAFLITSILLCPAEKSSAEECLQCHPDVARQMRGDSHHVQGTPANSLHCYACHWEASVDGKVNEQFHQKDMNRIDLVIWGKGNRPTEYATGETATIYATSAIGTDKERQEITKISRHCLACHSDQNNNTAPFSGDSNTPVKYAWDGLSIASRYEQKGVTSWGKYSTATTNKKKQLTKALSAHGNAAANEGGWSTSGGYDSRIPVTRGGGSASNVECYDCHNSHGSIIAGITTSYRSADGSRSNGLLKQTTAGKSGYQIAYTPSSNPDQGSKNPYNPGAGLCFDCHETESAGVTPWGYKSSFGADKPVIGYKDTHRFGSGIKGSTSRYANRQGRADIVSSHLKAEVFLKYSTTESISGLCTPCHDPHGVSPALGDKQVYAIPLLKGTWLTSPYKEDSPPTATPGRGAPASQGAMTASGATGSAKGPVSMQGMQYNIDRNTFSANSRIDENVDTFAGLCLKCHNRLNSKGDGKIARIHRAVKGWGDNKEHSFPCSKCHQAHNSGLPRLMQTNCFEEGPAGLRDNIGLTWLPEKKAAGTTREAAAENSTGKNNASKTDFVGCHVRQFGRNSSQPSKRSDSEWSEKLKW
jgi:hypothetical protein